MKQSYIVILVCVLVGIVLIWREIQRENKAHLLWRIAAILLALVGLACIVLPVTYEGHISAEEKNQAVLLTDGYSADSLKSYTHTRIYTLSKAIKKNYSKAILISSLDEITSAKPAISKLNLYGYGLDKEELQQLAKLPVSFHTASAPQGVTSVSWNSMLKTGERLRVQGTVNGSAGKSLKLVLKGLGTTLDSVAVLGNGSFDLSATPKHTGRAVYRLLLINDHDTLETGSIPVTVDPVKPLKVLMLSGSPNFEGKFLKNWLTANGYSAAVRNMISKDKYSQEFVNMDQMPLQKLSPALLDKFDVVLSDLDVLKTLNAAEASALKQAVTQKGIGVIVRADSTLHASFWLQQSFPVTKVSSQTQVITGFKLQGQVKATNKLLIDPVYIISQSYTQPLVADQQNHTLASMGMAGSGRIVFTTIANTHNWMLSGNAADYTALWSLLIGKAVKRVPVTEVWGIKTALATVNKRTDLQLETANPQPLITVNHLSVAPIRQINVPFAWDAPYWPGKAGWQQVQQGTATSQWVYVYPGNEWQTLKNSKILSDTKFLAASINSSAPVTKQIQQKVQIEVSKIYFYVLLIAACAWLWIEAKLA